MRKMRILFVCGGDHKYGSAKAAMRTIDLSQRHNDVEFIVLTQTYGEINEYCNKQCIENYAMGYKYATFRMDNAALKRVIKKNVKKLWVIVSNARSINKIERRVDLSSIDIIHTNHNRDIIGLMLAIKHKIPHIYHLREYAFGHSKVELLYNKQIQYMNNTNSFVAISNGVRHNWEEMGITSSKVSVIYDGVDVPKIIDNKRNNGEKLLLIMSGEISSLKGQDIVIRAISCLPKTIRSKIELHIYGDLSNNISFINTQKEFIKKKQLEESIIWEGYSNNLDRELARYDVGITTSKNEGFGLATASYMIAGLCVIASNTGANEELINHKKTGIIYNYGNESELADIIEYLYKNRKVAKDFGEKARDFALKRFTSQTYQDNVYNHYFSVLNENTNPSAIVERIK